VRELKNMHTHNALLFFASDKILTPFAELLTPRTCLGQSGGYPIEGKVYAGNTREE
jgi:hypothetical protein